jgi:hypothetical protein
MNNMKANDLGSLALIEVTLDGFPYVGSNLVQRFAFGEDRLVDGPSRKPTFGRFLDQKDYFTHL